jgi:hypothetical protein
MCAHIDKYSPENGGGEKGSDSIYHSYTPFEIEWLMNRNIMVKAIPLNAKPTLKLGAKNEAKVKATKARLARSSSFSAYNLRWNSFISISRESIALNYSLSRNFIEIAEKILNNAAISDFSALSWKSLYEIYCGYKGEDVA